MATKTTTKTHPVSDATKVLASVGLSDVVAAWDAADKHDAAVGRERGRLALACLPIGAYLLALDAKHGDATKANAAFREEMTTDYQARNKTFRFVKSRASKARNLARGTLALAEAGIDISTDADAVGAMGALASNVGADGIADAVATIAQAVTDGASVGDAIRSETKRARETKVTDTSLADTLTATLTGAVEALDAYASGGWDALTDAERAALKPLTKRLASLGASVNAALAK